MKKAILYARVSTKEQAEEGFSLSSQVKTIRAYAQKQGLIIAKEFIVPESARGTHERKKFQEMMRFLQRNPAMTTLLCEKVDRISRNFKDAITIDDWLNEDEHRSIHFIKQSLIIHKNARSSEKFQWDIHLVLARNYSNNLSEEARKGLDEKAAQGWFPGNQKRGYTTLGVQGHKEWVIDESPTSEAPYIKRAFELAGQGIYSIKQIRLRVVEDGWRSKAGKPIALSNLHRILIDPFYCGEFLWNGKRYISAKHAPMISKELFSQVQRNLQRRLPRTYQKHQFLFQNLIKCNECGRSIVGESQKGHRYYKCTRHNTNCSQRTYWREEDIQAEMISLLHGLEISEPEIIDWFKEAFKNSHEAEVDYHKEALRKLDVENERAQRRLNQLYDDKVDGKVPEEFYEQKFQRYVEEQERILRAKERHIHANVSYLKLGMALFELGRRARELYIRAIGLDEKRNLLKIIFSNLRLQDGKLLPDYNKPFLPLAEGVKTQNWLAIKDAFRNFEYLNELSLPDSIMVEVNSLLRIS